MSKIDQQMNAALMQGVDQWVTAVTIGAVSPANQPETTEFLRPQFDPVARPEHYNSHPSGVECVAITEHMTCMIGCAVKYLWRHGQKAGVSADEDLRKAIWCIERERQRLAHLKAATNGK
jgi:hypothetical protein